jgi:serine/threonine protein kinase
MNNELHNSLETGRVLNEKWVILEFIAKGGMGEVYLAHQIHLKRDVAIKIISREWIESFGEEDYERQVGLQRFRNEVQAMAPGAASQRAANI